MNLSLYQKQVFENYKNNAQIVRVLSEDWFSSEMYCPCCLNKKVSSFKNNQKVCDFFCERCRNEFQLKSSKKIFGRKINDGEYNTMMRFIKLDATPNFFFMHYCADDWLVKNLFLVPRFFVSRSVIEKRRPLSSMAQRVGWTGCNFLLQRIPEEGRIVIIKNERLIEQSRVYNAWKKMIFLNSKDPKLRGWTSDVLKCIQDLSKEEFTLKDAYSFKEYLKELHPENNNVDAKIRQQLQILRDNHVLKFKTRGMYELV